MASLSELIEKRAALERQIAAARSVARSQAIAQIQGLMELHGLTAADLLRSSHNGNGENAHAQGRSVVAPKYRDPETGQTWSGRGLKPKWLVARLADGKQVSDYAI